MKKTTILGISLALLAALSGCGGKTLHLVVANPSDMPRTGELAAWPLDSLASYGFQKPAGRGTSQWVLTDETGAELPYQLTYDRKIVFPVSLAARAEATYTLRKGNPLPVDTIATGAYYPERVDDIAWENDRIAFRTYGPALQASGEKAYGYDVWTKRVAYPVVKARYRKELDPAARQQIDSLRPHDPAAANAWARSISYHIDHGDGLDFYNVGPTLGAGTSALYPHDSIVYPYAYATYDILDNGPLRFTVRLTYLPLQVGSDTAVVETRLISLDAGSHLNRTVLQYNGLSVPTPLVSGLVMHAPSEEYEADAAQGYIAYADAENPENGRIYVGAVFPQSLVKAGMVYFSDEEQAGRRARGHVLAESLYRPGSEFVYYWGAGWSKWGFDSPAAWYKYVREEARKRRQPLLIRAE